MELSLKREVKQMTGNKIIKYKISLKNISPFFIGTGKENLDSIEIENNLPKIPATTITGLFRDYLIRHRKDKIYENVFLEKYSDRNKEKQRSINKEDKSYRKRSMVVIEDSESITPIENLSDSLLLRDHVSINPKTGAAKPKSLFQQISINKKCSFIVDIELQLFYNHSPKNKMPNDDYEKDLKELETSIEDFLGEINSGLVSIGGGNSLGYGKFSIENIKKGEFILSDVKQRYAYINNMDEEFLHEINVPISNLKSSCIKISFLCKNGLYIGGNEQSILSENENGYLIPSSTFKGLFRNSFDKFKYIMSEYNDNQVDNNPTYDEVEKIFFGTKDNKGKLIFSDILIDKSSGKFIEKTRIKIDRFTGGAMKGALIQEKIFAIEKPVDIIIDFSKIENTYQKELIQFLTWSVSEMMEKRFTIGSNKSIGYGFIEVTDFVALKNYKGGY